MQSWASNPGPGTGALIRGCVVVRGRQSSPKLLPWGQKDVAEERTGKAGENGQSSYARSKGGVWIRPSAPPMGNCGRPCMRGHSQDQLKAHEGGINKYPYAKVDVGVAIDWVTGRSPKHEAAGSACAWWLNVQSGPCKSSPPQEGRPAAGWKTTVSKRVSMAPGGRRLLKRGKPRALGVAGLEVEDLSHSGALGSNRPACHGKVSSPGVRPQREP